MFAVGDKLVAKKSVAGFFDKGDIIKLTNVSKNGLIAYCPLESSESCSEKGLMNFTTCEEFFDKLEEKEKTAPSVSKELIQHIIDNSKIRVSTAFDKCTIVACQLPNGFVIVESSSCVSPENYDKNIGFEICLRKIVDKLWELEGYALQDFLHEESKEDDDECPYGCEDCYECPCEQECDDCEYDCEDEESEEDEDVDCENCPSYNECYNN